MTDRFMEIPLSKLVISSRNARRTDTAEGIGELAASIEAHGLLQNLTVRPVSKANGKQPVTYEVIAGGRRLTALSMLAQRKRIPKGYKVPCRVLPEGAELEASVAENVVRRPLHPADEFEAFSDLHREGHGAEEIAARFGVSPTVVLQRLKLAAVSPALIAAYRAGEMTLDQLMAFTVTDDHEAQERVWQESPPYAREPRLIRRALTSTLIAGNDRRARFVGAEAYEAAGGTVIRDLFDTESEGYFADSQLLDRLVSEKLAAAAEPVRAEGWAWVEVMPQMDYAALGRMSRVQPTAEPIPEEIQEKARALGEEYDRLVEGLEDDPPEETLERLEKLSAEIDRLSEPEFSWSQEDKARAGAIVTINPAGEVFVDRGLVKPGPRGDSSSDPVVPEAEREERQTRSHSDALLEDLSAHRTAALRETLAGKPRIALAALAQALVLPIFFGAHLGTCLGIRMDAVDLRASAEGIGGSPAIQAIAERHQSWSDRLPAEPDLWAWLLRQEPDTVLELVAYCVATTVNVLRRGIEPDRHNRREDADRLAIATGLDMRLWWTATRESYFARVPKSQILAAVAEAVSPQATENIAGMKKEAMAARAEELLDGTGWLPEPLRPPTAGTTEHT